MLSSLYRSFILQFPRTVLALVTALIIALGFSAVHLEIDASADTLLLEGDKDLAFSREIAARYSTLDFVVITYAPHSEDLLSEHSIASLQKLSTELENLSMVDSVLSILNVPLLQSPVKPIKELLKKIPTLTTPNVDKALAKHEFLNSPLYKEHLVSKDFKTTALMVSLKDDPEYLAIRDKREFFYKLKQTRALMAPEKEKLKQLDKEYKEVKERLRAQTHETIVAIRAIMQTYQEEATLYLGGVPMIADDMISYVKSDLQTFSYAVIILLIIMLTVLFKESRWVMLPILICIAVVVSASGFMAFLGWEITVVSSNFISLLLILTISLVIHLSVKYRELFMKNPKWTQEELALETVLSMIKPSFFVVITTIAGFSSLVFSQILPVMNFGWMMSIGIMIALLLAFLIFPTLVVILAQKDKAIHQINEPKVTGVLAHFAHKHGMVVLAVSVLAVIFSISGASKLYVENSFIDYFKKDSEIYKGMKTIDQNLGGTTPLDIIVTFKDVEAAKTELSSDDMLDQFDDEYENQTYEEEYWFTEYKMDKIKRIHTYLDSLPEIGKVLSLATIGDIAKILNGGEKLDSFSLALLYKKLPQEYREQVLDPYMNIKENQLRVTMRIIDSQKDLRRNALLQKIEADVSKILNPEYENFKLSNMMVLYNNMLQSLFNSQIRTIGSVLLILFAMFLVLFRSIKVALIAMIVNIVPVGVIFGFMGWFHIPLDMMTITIAAISIGIAVDNTIHYIHRFKIEYKQCEDYTTSLFNSHKSIGIAMFYTSFSIFMGFSVLMLSAFVPTIYFGMLTSLAMFMAVVADLMMLPVLLVMLKPFGKGKS